MKQSPRISVIVPVYNVAAWLSRCVDSILAQTYENLEILLVDDGSADDSARGVTSHGDGGVGAEAK